jgi:hypothetical protein
MKRRTRPGRVEQVQRDRVRHDLAHQAHHLVLEGRLELRVPVHERDPGRHRQLGDPRLGQADDAVRRRRVEAPRGVARLDVALLGEAQDHLAAVGVGDDALQDAVEHEVLLHLVHPLVEQGLALGAIDHLQVRLELVALGVEHLLQHDVLRQLRADDVALRMGLEGYRWHSVAAARASAPAQIGKVDPGQR